MISVSDNVNKRDRKSALPVRLPVNVAHLQDTEESSRSHMIQSADVLCKKYDCVLTHHSLSSSPSTIIISPSEKVSSSGLSARQLNRAFTLLGLCFWSKYKCFKISDITINMYIQISSDIYIKEK